MHLNTSRPKSLFVTIALVLLSLSAVADIPFRNHRYDSWQALVLPKDAIVFVGNSITDMHPWCEAFGNDPRIVNRGNSGALSDEVVEHLDTWLPAHPAKVFLMIGTNDLGSDVPVDHVVANIAAIVSRVRHESPATELYLQSILPAKDQRLRTLETIRQANESISLLAQQHENTFYVDLFTPLHPLVNDATLSFDQLHLTAAGYQLWCDIIAPLVGLKPVYDSQAPYLQQSGPLWGSDAMRATYFSLLPIEQADTVLLGDEMIKCGEWNELMHSTHFKNRGTGWGYGGSINRTRSMAEIAFAHQMPSCVVLYTGTEDVVLSQRDLSEVKRDYAALVDTLLSRSSDGVVALMTLMPVAGGSKRVQAMNRWIRTLAARNPRLRLVDIYAELADSKGLPLAECIRDNYLYGQGYQAVARLLSRQLRMH